jgi:hypothetical protein
MPKKTSKTATETEQVTTPAPVVESAEADNGAPESGIEAADSLA